MLGIPAGGGMSAEMQEALLKAIEEQGLDPQKIPMLTIERNGQRELIPMCLLDEKKAREIADQRSASSQVQDSFEEFSRRLLTDISQLNSTLLLQANMTRQLMQENRGIVQNMTLLGSSQEKDLESMSSDLMQLTTKIMIVLKSKPKKPKSDVWKTIYM